MARQNIVPGMLVFLPSRPDVGIGKVVEVDKEETCTVWFLFYAPALLVDSEKLEVVNAQDVVCWFPELDRTRRSIDSEYAEKAIDAIVARSNFYKVPKR